MVSMREHDGRQQKSNIMQASKAGSSRGGALIPANRDNPRTNRRITMTDTERARVAYETFHGGFSAGAPFPAWDEAPSWLRDVVRVAYLQGTLDGRK
jgi:hypothetical protein